MLDNQTSMKRHQPDDPSEPPQRGDARPAGALYVVATPIGNLSDLSQRAASTLREVAWVAAEDTRASRVLIDHIGGGGQTLFALHQHNEARASGPLIERLQAGESGALISDAGTPAISDPGARLVAAAHQAAIRVVPIPGASAPIALLSAAGLPPAPFVFEGFLPPRAKARAHRLQTVRAHCDALGAHLVLFEAPHRMVETLQALREAYEAQRPLVIGRELTKRFEEVQRTSVGEAAAWLAARESRLRGEFVLAIAAPAGRAVQGEHAAQDTDAPDQASDDAPAAAPVTPVMLPAAAPLLERLLQDLPLSRAVKLARDLSGAPHRDLYALALQLKGGDAKGRGAAARHDAAEPDSDAPDSGTAR